HAAWVVVADIEGDQLALVIAILRNIVDHGGAGEAVHYPKANGIFVKHGLEHTAHGAFLAPHFDTGRLLIPKIPAISHGYNAGILLGIIICSAALKGACLVNNPVPWNLVSLPGQLEQAVYALHLATRH